MCRPLTLVASLAVLAGCGGAERERPGADADRAAVQERVATYLRHYAAGDGERACAQYTRALRARSDARAAANGDGSCAAALAALGPEIVRAIPAAEREAFTTQLTDPAAVHVELEGGHALATLEGVAANRLRLVRSGDRWLIDELGMPTG
jgi:hypothetical protein